jgi:hypothetical protein
VSSIRGIGSQLGFNRKTHARRDRTVATGEARPERRDRRGATGEARPDISPRARSDVIDACLRCQGLRCGAEYFKSTINVILEATVACVGSD